MLEKPRTATLSALNEELAGLVYPLGERTVLGRSSKAEVFLPDVTVSRRHCEIRRENNGFIIEDLGSRLGTKVNGMRVERVQLASGDVVSLGKFRLRVDVAGQLAPPTDPNIVAPEGTIALGQAAPLPLKQVDVEDFSLAEALARDAQGDVAIAKLREYLEIVQTFGEAIQATLDLDALMDKTLASLFRVFRKMDAGAVFLKDPDSGLLHYRYGRQRQREAKRVEGISSTILNYADQERRAVLCLDAQTDSRFQAAASVMMGGMGTHLCVPLICREETLGFLYMLAAGRMGSFVEDDLNLVIALAGPVAVCVKNAMLVEEVEREAAIRTGLQRYVSGEVAETLLAQDVEDVLEGQRREGVCLFCDIVGFTPLAEQLSADRVVDLLNRYFDTMMDIVFAYGGSINKFGGDSLLAVWGALGSAEQCEGDVLRAAFAMQNAVFGLNRQLRAESHPSISMTIGVSSGSFFAGNVGSERRMEFMVIGDTVNVAARIQGLAHPGQVLTAGETVETLTDRAALVDYGAVQLRGRSEPSRVVSPRSLLQSEKDGTRTLLASIPIQASVEGSGQPSAERLQVVQAVVGPDRLELGVLCDSPPPDGARLVIACELPELPGLASTPFAGRLVGVEAAPGREGYLLRVEVDEPPELVVGLLTPGTRLPAAGELRHKH